MRAQIILDWQATTQQSKDQRGLVIQDTVLTYTELSRWEGVLDTLRRNEEDARKMEELVGQRIQALYKDPKQYYPNTDAGRAELIASLQAKLVEVEGYEAWR